MLDKLILVGGFLGSGKTTLLAEAARKLTQQGKPVGLITNDQAPELVDTKLLTGIGKGVAEVSGSCFCCNFNGFVGAVQSLEEQGAKIIIAEPVGSCTDLSATIMNPLKKFEPQWNLAPLTVLVDPNRLPEILGQAESSVDADALYIMQLQLAEADRILVSKCDHPLLSDTQLQKGQMLLEKHYPDKRIAFISSRTGEGLDAWLSEIQSASDAGTTIVPVDYDRYAHGEAVLGWLNATAAVPPQTNGLEFLTDLLSAFHSEIKKTNSELGHVKALVQANGSEWVGSITGNVTNSRANIEVRQMESHAKDSSLTLNARVQMPPESLEVLVRNLFERQGLSVSTLRCLMPGRPNPTHRFVEMVGM